MDGLLGGHDFPLHSLRLKCFADAAKEANPGTVLGRKDTDAGAVPDDIDPVQDIVDGQTRLYGAEASQSKLVARPEVHLDVGRHMIRVGESTPKSASVGGVCAKDL